jgi:NADH:ubiquinone oxidoreductase subunit 3 (subunit A)
MSFAAAALLEFLGLVVLAPALVLGVAVLLAGRPGWMARPERGRRAAAEPGIQTFLMLAVLAVVGIALVFVVPFAVAMSPLGHRETGLLGLFLAVLVALGVGYAWRRGALRWQ